MSHTDIIKEDNSCSICQIMLCKNISDVLFTQFLTAANRVKMKHKKIADIQYKNEWVSNVSAISWLELIAECRQFACPTHRTGFL